MADLLKVLSSPVRRYFNPRFEALAAATSDVSGTLAELRREVDQVAASVETVRMTDEQRDRLRQAEQLARVDLTVHNADGPHPSFGGRLSRAVSAAECRDPAYLAWWDLLEDREVHAVASVAGGPVPAHFNRKVWEWAAIAEAASAAGVLAPGRRALGFGVGSEPLPALLASRGLDVVATDQDRQQAGDWATTEQHMSGLADLSRPHLLPDEELARRVRTRAVDMNEVPDDLGVFDLVWSSCCLEHLGSPELGLCFVERTLDLLAPGGVSVHTTELELTRRASTADYGHCAVYRPEDLVALQERVRARGAEMELSLRVSLDTAEDRWISLVLQPGGTVLRDEAHLKLVIGDSVSTSFVVVIRRPA